MWNRHESEAIEKLYSKIELDQFDVAKCFKPLEWLAIVAADSARNVSFTRNWFRVPKKRTMTAEARFQFLIYDDGEKDGTDRWRKFFKTLVRKLHIHPSRQNEISIGFSFLACHPLKLAKQQPNAYVYVSFFLTFSTTNLDLRCSRFESV